jgi:hypothetical protein
MLTAAYHMLKNATEYQDLGAQHFARRDRSKAILRLGRPRAGRGGLPRPSHGTGRLRQSRKRKSFIPFRCRSAISGRIVGVLSPLLEIATR